MLSAVKTYAPSHMTQSTMVAGAVARQAEDLKMVKYSYLGMNTQAFFFTRVTIKTPVGTWPFPSNISVRAGSLALSHN